MVSPPGRFGQGPARRALRGRGSGGFARRRRNSDFRAEAGIVHHQRDIRLQGRALGQLKDALQQIGGHGLGGDAVLGGVGTLWGPLIGAAVLIPVSELSRSYLGGSGSGVDLMIYGLLIMIVALARPQGLVSLLGVRSQAGGGDGRAS